MSKNVMKNICHSYSMQDTLLIYSEFVFRSGIRQSLRGDVPEINLITGIVNSLGEGDEPQGNEDPGLNDLETFNMLLASPDTEIEQNTSREDQDSIQFVAGEAALCRLTASLDSSPPISDVTPPNKVLLPGV